MKFRSHAWRGANGLCLFGLGPEVARTVANVPSSSATFTLCLQHRAERREEVLPQAQRDAVALDLVSSDAVALREILVLSGPQLGGEGGIVEQDVVLEIELEASAVEVGASDQADAAVDDHRLRVE